VAVNESSKKISRRELLRGAGFAGAAAIFPGSLHGIAESEGEVLPDEISSAAVSRAPMVGVPQNLTMEETEILDAMIGRLIPNDQYGPGAREAGALDYIDRELGGALASSREAYRAGLLATDRFSQYTRGAPFIELDEKDQDSVLFDLQTGGATGSGAGFLGSSAGFFNMVRGHTWQATFGDPVYGGNQDFIGWDLLRYPGPRRAVSPEDQEALEAGSLEPLRRSAYE
jgi:gluconate 2-dehydrogenase gamma chain